MTRERLPNRRNSHTFRFEHDGITFFGMVSFYEDGRPAEVFLDAGKVGSMIHSICRDGAVAMSIALQYGAPVEVLREALLRTNEGEAAGPFCKLLDLVEEHEPLPPGSKLVEVEE